MVVPVSSVGNVNIDIATAAIDTPTTTTSVGEADDNNYNDNDGNNDTATEAATTGDLTEITCALVITRATNDCMRVAASSWLALESLIAGYPAAALLASETWRVPFQVQLSLVR